MIVSIYTVSLNALSNLRCNLGFCKIRENFLAEIFLILPSCHASSCKGAKKVWNSSSSRGANFHSLVLFHYQTREYKQTLENLNTMYMDIFQ